MKCRWQTRSDMYLEMNANLSGACIRLGNISVTVHHPGSVYNATTATATVERRTYAINIYKAWRGKEERSPCATDRSI